jgi:dienelactone hydrolase
MRQFSILMSCALLVLSAGAGAATPRAPSVPPADAPQLAALGKHAVGVRTLSLVNPAQPDLLLGVRSGGKQTSSDRALEVHLWYPAKAGAPSPGGVYAARLPMSGAAGTTFTVPALASRDAAPAGGTFPLVVISHGFGGWGTFMSYLGENLASKGYVVAAIDHADPAFTDGAGFMLSFGSVMMQRSRDQQFVIGELLRRARTGGDAVAALIAPQPVGLIGYSMGGYGALATAGAGYDANSAAFKGLPPGVLPAAGTAQVGALVLLAPWGGQPASRAWSAKSLAAVGAPALVISGDQDDIVDYRQGVSWIFDALKGSRRHLLVYQNARHNVGGNPAPEAAAGDFVASEYFEEPVWRKDRLMAINQHFITAFLDLHLKGERAKSRYLDLAPAIANDAAWPLPFGSSSGAAYATGADATKGYWPGFQRRWALGLEMHQRERGQ